MIKLKDLAFPKSLRYRTGSKNLPIDFFFQAIPVSKRIDFLLGYFSSTAINTLSEGFASFIARGGTMRIITNHVLSKDDINIIKKVEEDEIEDYSSIINDYHQLKDTLNSYGKHFFNCLAFLIKEKRLQLVCVKPKNSKRGISHYKCGIFNDEESKVFFSSSCNFTFNGLLENLEQLTVQRSWGYDIEIESIREEEEYFESIFSGKADFVKYLSSSELQEAIISDFGGKDENELIADEIELLKNKKERLKENPHLQKLIEDLETSVVQEINKPRFPYKKPRDYQQIAYENWRKNNFQGILAMATGTGKTLTSLNILLEEYKKSGTYQAVIVVPTQALATQWHHEAKSFRFENIISTVGNTEWYQHVSSLKKRDNLQLKNDYIVITTYATFNGEKFQSFIKELKNADNAIFIADEAHNLGAPKSLSNLPNLFQKRIGLSATPERIYDEEGSIDLYNFFNSHPPCYTYSFSMQKAIEEEVLCPYNYYPKFITLENDESAVYKRLSIELMQYFDPVKKTFSPSAEHLLLKRKQIVHKARNKKSTLKSILQDHELKDNKLSYTFIYVPEGFEPKYSDYDSYSLENGDQRIINEYSDILNSYGYKTHQFLGDTENREKILRQFSEGKINILLSMKCLDEGIDIPRAQTAIFCASTGNPRQFIQRRGRVLRRHDDKRVATIYDLVVLPYIEDIKDFNNDDLSSFERSLFLSELKRVINFLMLASNRNEIFSGQLEEICNSFDINLYDLYNNLIESQNNCN